MIGTHICLYQPRLPHHTGTLVARNFVVLPSEDAPQHVGGHVGAIGWNRHHVWPVAMGGLRAQRADRVPEAHWDGLLAIKCLTMTAQTKKIIEQKP